MRRATVVLAAAVVLGALGFLWLVLLPLRLLLARQQGRAALTLERELAAGLVGYLLGRRSRPVTDPAGPVPP
jgi:hypothetical protein